MSERVKRKNARALLTKSGYSVGGHLAKDKEMIGEAVREHESHMHAGKPKTRLKLASGGACEGMDTGGRADHKPRGGGKRGKKGGTTVNVIVAHPHPKPMPVPVQVGAGPGGPGAPPPPGPDMAGPGPGGPMPPGGPPMGAKKGGRTGLKSGGKAKFTVPMEEGGGGGLGRLSKAKAYGA